MTFRSLQMSHFQLIIPREGAWDVVNELGQLQLAHIIDCGDPTYRPFFNQYKRCDQSLQKINFLTNTLKDKKIEIEEFDEKQKNFIDNIHEVWKDKAIQSGIEQVKLIDKFQNQVLEEWQRYQDISGRIDKLKQNKKLILEKLASIQAVESLYPNRDQAPLDENNYGEPNVQGRLKGVSFIVGVVAMDSEIRLAKMMYRVSMGYAYIKTIENFKFEDLKSFKEKVVLVMYPNSSGNVLERKIKRVMQTFCVNNFIISQQQMNVKSEKSRLIQQYQQVSNLLLLNQTQMLSFLQRIKSVHYIENWRLYFWKERHLYQTLDKMEVREQFFSVRIYVPVELAANLSLRLNRISPSPSLHQIPITKPPTAFRVTQYTQIAQQITNTYGIPRYQQINPTIFTVVTFPFFFGVMFGDMAHGAILFALGLYLIFYEEAVKKSKLGVLASLKYMITMMGFFSFYCGWIYNDFLGMPINVFGSCYDPPPRFSEQGQNKDLMIAKRFFPTSEDCMYSIGIDPIWGRANNELVYINALKMKISVIIAIIHMTLGVIIKAFNSIYFKKRLEYYFEFWPQVIFLVLLFGYMDFLIIFKWFKQQQWTKKESDYNKAPSIISTMMNIGLKLGKTSTVYDGNSNMWGETGNSSQDGIQLFILIIAFICIPLMLLPKPLIEINQIKKHHQQHPLNVPSMEELQREMELQGKLLNKKKVQDSDIKEGHDSSEIFVHQLIETIQFVLGAVSNTASYLRLWALSLAHSQLAKVFFDKLMVTGFNVPVFVALPAFIIGFYLLCWITFGVLMCMDTMECFLHSLRLHWVEFQNKFYDGDGYKYEPFSFKSAILDYKSANS